MKKLSLLLLATLLNACSSEVSSIKNDQDKQLNQNTGYVLIGIDTSHNIKSVHIDGPKDIVITHEDLKSGTSFVFTDLPQGTYTIEKIKLNRYWYVDFDQEDLWQFEVSPQGVNYVGHLELSQSYWFFGTATELVNRSSEALEFMEESYPNILANRRLFYGGPGDDNFFSLLEQLEGASRD